MFYVIVQVNERLHEMSINFLQGGIGNKDYTKVDSGDVVILPAFGATIQEMQLLDKKYVNTNKRLLFITCLCLFLIFALMS